MANLVLREITCLHFLSQFISFFLLPLSSDACFEQAFYRRLEKTYLSNHVFQTVFVRGEIECGLQCLREEACLSVNFGAAQENGLDICELNNASIEMSKRSDVSERVGFTHLNPMFSLGSKTRPAGKSCLDILTRTAEASFLSSGEYWIDIDSFGALKVFCDMETDGGGWTLVTNIILPDSNGFDWSLAPDYRQISDYNLNNLGVTPSALNALKRRMPFTQLRFHCHQKIPGRTFHIMTKKGSSGQSVVEYFTAKTNVFPNACGSFTRLSDDNSILAQECSKWGRESGKFFVGKWSYDWTVVDRLLVKHTALVASKAHWLIQPSKDGRWECDGYNNARSAGDFWKIYVR